MEAVMSRNELKDIIKECYLEIKNDEQSITGYKIKSIYQEILELENYSSFINEAIDIKEIGRKIKVRIKNIIRRIIEIITGIIDKIKKFFEKRISNLKVKNGNKRIKLSVTSNINEAYSDITDMEDNMKSYKVDAKCFLNYEFVDTNGLKNLTLKAIRILGERGIEGKVENLDQLTKLCNQFIKKTYKSNNKIGPIENAESSNEYTKTLNFFLNKEIKEVENNYDGREYVLNDFHNQMKNIFDRNSKILKSIDESVKHLKEEYLSIIDELSDSNFENLDQEYYKNISTILKYVTIIMEFTSFISGKITQSNLSIQQLLVNISM